MGVRHRYDGTQVTNAPPFRQINPYVMRGRNESAIYYAQLIDIERTHRYIREYNRGRTHADRLTLFQVLIAATVRVLAERPQLNRFVSGRRIYQRKRIQVSFIVKKELSDDGTETNAKVTFAPDDTLFAVRKRINEHVAAAKAQSGNSSDREIEIVTKLPRFVLNMIVAGFKTLDYFGIAPSRMIELDPLYTSVYVANLGSVGLDAPYHHLFEWGNASIFMVVGRPERRLIAVGGGRFETKLAIEIKYTLDDRITEGIYVARSLTRFRDYIQEPEPLESPPERDGLDLQHYADPPD